MQILGWGIVSHGFRGFRGWGKRITPQRRDKRRGGREKAEMGKGEIELIFHGWEFVTWSGFME
jgi:hypothetical protein